MQEELSPSFLSSFLLTRRLGFDALTAVAMSLGAAAVAAAFSPINPFQAQIARSWPSSPSARVGVPHHPDAAGARLLDLGRDPARPPDRKPPEAVELEAGASLGWRTPLILLSVLERSRCSSTGS
jgi:hypothetical protein